MRRGHAPKLVRVASLRLPRHPTPGALPSVQHGRTALALCYKRTFDYHGRANVARRTFFSFHYDRDIWRASNVRNIGTIDPVARAGFTDASLWEEAKKKGDAAIKALILDGLKNTSVTVVLIGAKTADRPWVKYEIDESVKRGNGLMGVRIHMLKDQKGNTDLPGAVPKALLDGGYPVYDWNRDSIGRWIEKAAVAAGK